METPGATEAAGVRTILALDNWTLAIDSQDIAWLTIDRPDESSNALSRVVLEELGRAVETLGDLKVHGTIVRSVKPSGFIAGADIAEFEGLTEPEETRAQIETVHQLFNRIESLPFPSVALIHGFCLGGGLELALACRYRVALDEPSTRIGLPEILLGIHPGFGGTVRSVERIGVQAAMDLMLTGKSLDARRAARLGLIDRAVPKRYFEHAARTLIARCPPRQQPGRTARALNTRLARPGVAALIRREVRQRAREAHYPAPYALIRLWQDHGGDRARMMEAEARSIAALFVTPTSRNLQRLFFLQEKAKQQGRAAAFEPQHVHVIGAGTMGGDIAAWCALRGLRVTLQDRAPEYAAAAMERAAKLFKRRVRDRYRRQQTADRLSLDLAGAGIERADVVIEAIVEKLDAKQALFSEIESRARADALLATNTSSIPLEDIAAALQAPERLVGIHFFNPVASMQLIEVVRGAATSARAAAQAAAFTTAIDRLAVTVSSSPGFLVNRILSPYLQEAMLLVESGHGPREVDDVALEFGMAMGPLEVADTVGLDVCLLVGEVLSERIGGDVPAILGQKVGSGRTGKKSGSGFYEYRKGKPVRGRAATGGSDRTLRDRLVLRLLNEAVACLRENVVDGADAIDLGMVFATGFAPFRGGPLHYARERGIAECRARLAELAEQHGDRFAPDEGWDTLAATLESRTP